MLARALPGVAVVVGESRYDAGRLAEERAGRDGSRAGRRLSASPDRAGRRSAAGLRGRLERFAAVRAAVCASRSQPRPSPMRRWCRPVMRRAVDRVARAVGIRTAFQVTRTLGAPRTIVESVRLCRGAVAVARVCGCRDRPARALFFRYRGRGLASRRLDGLSRPSSLLASRRQAHRAPRRGLPRPPSC